MKNEVIKVVIGIIATVIIGGTVFGGFTIHNYRERIAELTGELSAATADTAELTAGNLRLRTVVGELEDTVAEYRRELEQTERELRTAAAELQESHRAIGDLQAEIAAGTGRAGEFVEQLDAATAEGLRILDRIRERNEQVTEEDAD